MKRDVLKTRKGHGVDRANVSTIIILVIAIACDSGVL